MIVKGIGASKGIAVGPIRTLVKADLSVEDGPGSGAESECKRLEEALAQAGQELSHLYEKAKAAGITAVVFDRNGYLYHGRVKALADAARNGGLNF